MKKLNECYNLPQMTSTLTDWYVPISLIKLKNSLVSGDVVSSKTLIKFKGVIQPLTEQEISLKPEEQRAWIWLKINCAPDTKLKVGEYISFNTIEYRIHARLDFAIYGYVEYHLVQDYIHAS